MGIGSQLVNDDLVEIPIKEKPVVTGGLFFQPESLKAFPLQRLAEMILQYYHQEDLLPALGEK